MIVIKRVHEVPAPADGYRVLVDRLWPRGLTKASAAIDAWLKDVAPSNSLRQWFGHDITRWDEFEQRYREELAAAAVLAPLADLRSRAQNGPVTLLFAKKDEVKNNAVVLRAVLLQMT